MFEWDEAKNERNRIERGFNFAFAAQIFEGDTIERDDTRRDYGERRTVAIGQVERIVLVVVFTPREDALRIISAQRASRRERRVYQQAISE